jgi:hypothetical protein
VSPLKPLALLPRFPMYAAFPRSEYYQGIRLPSRHLPPCGWSIQLAYSAKTKTAMDLPGSSDASISTRAVPLDPAGTSGGLTFDGRLCMAFHVFERVGFRSVITRLI